MKIFFHLKAYLEKYNYFEERTFSIINLERYQNTYDSYDYTSLDLINNNRDFV